MGVKQADVDLDGRVDAVLEVMPADGSWARQGCVLARRTSRGWTAALLTSNLGNLNMHLECAAPVRAGDTVFLRTTMIADGGPNYLMTCTGDADCGGCGPCFTFNNGGMRCTLDCQAEEDCPPPSSGCSNMGVCKQN